MQQQHLSAPRAASVAQPRYDSIHWSAAAAAAAAAVAQLNARLFVRALAGKTKADSCQEMALINVIIL